MIPDKPGEWHSRDGRRIVVFEWDGGYCWKLCAYGQTSKGLHELQGDDWLPAVAPTFPELPPKPGLILARVKGGMHIEWFMRSRVGKQFVDSLGCRYLPESLTVVPHPDNDPEAVALITAK